ncbi:hypothetical protein K443DRAFT_15572 [Laccaria amethystina LaAM-08-1]|uniref:Uncharacterized protein n=1 Tax=Laccaria amethystina LaAM-08-1 TaxID=1095629 RepID=A0A0C9X0E4_9AGAR|nr:hypothetical protein K443DRAFT_15572 [Laccaria amethystina LaAM-08-1]
MTNKYHTSHVQTISFSPTITTTTSATTNHNHIHRSTTANHPNNDDKVATPCPIHPPPSSTAMNSGVQNLVISLGAMQLTPLPLHFTSYSSANPHDGVVAASPTDER